MSTLEETSGVTKSKPLMDALERLYFVYNKRGYVTPDPLQFLYDFPDPRDAELVAFLASSLAYGRVRQILNSVEKLLAPMDGRVRDFVLSHNEAEFAAIYCPFRHRFNDGCDMARLLCGLKASLEDYGTLEAAFLSCLGESDENVISASSKFSRMVCRYFPGGESFLVSDPAKGSACKRLFLSLRWLVRKDEVDLGIWRKVAPAKLIVPLDTHMFRIASELGFTTRRNADIRAAEEVTRNFMKYSPSDPVKYDFSLTRFGINPELSRISPDFTKLV